MGIIDRHDDGVGLLQLTEQVDECGPGRQRIATRDANPSQSLQA
jgi:hypothetical protein